MCPDYCTLDIAAAVISILLLIMTFVYAWMVMRNFGRGLKDQSTSTVTFFGPLEPHPVLQSHESRRLLAQSTARTRPCLCGLTG